MKVVFMGTRGVPASYSGFETFVEQLGFRLAERGWEVSVYCRKHHITYSEPIYRGMKLIKLPTIPNKFLDTIVHTILSMFHAALFERPDLIYICGQGNAPALALAKIFGFPNIINVDGPDWQRQKWGRFASWYLKTCERIALETADVVISDSKAVKEYYLKSYKADTTCIAYGADVPAERPHAGILEQFGLEDRGYFLFVGRLVPENCAHHLVRAFETLSTDKKCVIVGDAPYAAEYINSLKRTSNPNVIFTGYVFGDGYKELGTHAYAFCLTSEVGGTHPALVEELAFGNCVIVNDTPANLEVIGDAGLSYEGARGEESLKDVLQWTLDNPGEVEIYRRKALERVQQEYSWDVITDRYERLFCQVLGKELKGVSAEHP